MVNKDFQNGQVILGPTSAKASAVKTLWRYLDVSVHEILSVQVVDRFHDRLEHCNASVERSIFPGPVQPVLERATPAQLHLNVQPGDTAVS